MRRTTTLIVAAAALMIATAAPTFAADLVGSDLAAAPSLNIGSPITSVQTEQPPGVTLPLAAPAPGVVVKVRLQHGEPLVNSTAGFSILRGAAPIFTARTIPQLPNFAWVTAQPAGIRTFELDPGARIEAGERLAYRQITGVSPDLFSGVAAGLIYFKFSDHTAGTENYASNQPTEILMQMRIEPDVDADGRGDDTQDGNVASACAGLTVTKLGTSGDDVIVGTSGDDVIATGGGDDRVFGLDGNDILCGGDGNDKIKGGPGLDKLYGDAGRDKLRGGAGKDYCNGGSGTDSAKKCEVAKQL